MVVRQGQAFWKVQGRNESPQEYAKGNRKKADVFASVFVVPAATFAP